MMRVVWRRWLADRLDRQDGQGLAEYALLLGLISITAIAIMGAVGQSILGAWWTQACTSMATVITMSC